jgi:hypothetical protein
MADTELNAESKGTTRRAALRTGAVVAGAAWSVPVLTAIGVSPAHADTPSGVQPGGGTKTPPTTPKPTPSTPGVTPPAPEEEVLGSRRVQAAAPAVKAQAAELPRTGVEAGPAVATAAALIAGGAAIVKATSKRTEEQPEE